MIAIRVEDAEDGNGRNTENTKGALCGLGILAALAALCVFGCGKKGPPLPPLVKLPVAPPEVIAERRGETVDLRFVVPANNTDGTRPANIAGAEVYAITGAAAAAPRQYTDAQLLKYGTKVATVAVKAPKDPNLTADPDEPADEVDAPEGAGLDQGATARVSESLTAAALTPVDVPPDLNTPPQPGVPPPDTAPADTASASGPLLGPSGSPASRTYAVVGVSTRGKHGPASRRIVVPLVPPPPPPAAPAISYDEHAVTVTWPPVGAASAPPEGGDLLPSRIIGASRPVIAYTVYDVADPDAAVKVTITPVAEPKYEDPRMTWGEKRCYAVRAAERVAGTLIESDLSPSRCETLKDTFPPAAPKGLTAIASDGAINLIWEANQESDLAGYVVLRARAPSDRLEPMTPEPIQETSFRDAVQPGIAFVYAVRAVDRAGNASSPSAQVTETAR